MCSERRMAGGGWVRQLDHFHRYRRTVTRNGVEVERFDPWLCWSIGSRRVVIETRHSYGIGIMWGWRVGNFSRIRQRFIEIGPLTLILYCGICEAYNPRKRRVKDDEWPDVIG